MKALVVFESMFGNSEKIARSIADGLDDYVDVSVRDVSEQPQAPAGRFDIIVVGGPTHALGMSTPRSRRAAWLNGGRMGVRHTGMREWIGELLPPHAEVLGVFDTRVHAARHLPGSAARAGTRALRAKVGSGLARPQSFYVTGMAGGPVPGEIERARAWGQTLALLAGATPKADHRHLAAVPDQRVDREERRLERPIR